MKSQFNILLLILVVTSGIAVVAMSPLVVKAEEQVMKAEPIVLMEKFTGTWCEPCGAVAPVVSQLWTDYGPTKLAIIEYHLNGASADPFNIKESSSRGTYYQVTSLPTIRIDGSTEIGTISYENCSNAINTRLNVSRCFDISISGSIKTGSVTIHVEQMASINVTNIRLRCAVLESAKYYWGGTVADNIYNHIVRAIPLASAIQMPMANPANFTKQFTVGADWALDKLSFVAYLQNDDNKEIQQACFIGYGCVVPEISPLVVIPVGGLFVAVYAIAVHGRRKGHDD